MTQQNLLIVVALGALAAYLVTRNTGAESTSPAPGYTPIDPATGQPITYYPPGTLDETYL